MHFDSLAILERVLGFAGLALSNGILWWGIFRLVPDTLNNYGFDYFNWKRYRRQGLLTASALLVSGNILLALVPKMTVSPLPLGAEAGLALVLVSLWGIWRLDHAFKVIPDRFHLTGSIGACMFLGAQLMAAAKVNAIAPWYPAAIQIGVGLLLPAVILALNKLYTYYRKADGLGLGDVKTLIWLPLILGDQVWMAFAAACLLAALVQVVKAVCTRRLHGREPFAFGPYIVSAVVAIMTLNGLTAP